MHFFIYNKPRPPPRCCSVTKSHLPLAGGLQHAVLLISAVARSLLSLMSIESVMLSNHLILCHPLLLLPSFFPNQSVLCIRWHKKVKVFYISPHCSSKFIVVAILLWPLDPSTLEGRGNVNDFSGCLFLLKD